MPQETRFSYYVEQSLDELALVGELFLSAIAISEGLMWNLSGKSHHALK